MESTPRWKVRNTRLRYIKDIFQCKSYWTLIFQWISLVEYIPCYSTQAVHSVSYLPVGYPRTKILIKQNIKRRTGPAPYVLYCTVQNTIQLRFMGIVLYEYWRAVYCTYSTSYGHPSVHPVMQTLCILLCSLLCKGNCAAHGLLLSPWRSVQSTVLKGLKYSFFTVYRTVSYCKWIHPPPPTAIVQGKWGMSIQRPAD